MEKLKDIDIQIILALAENNMNESRTARCLFMSRNTVVYHIAKIENITGLNASNFYDLVKLVQMVKEGGV